MGTQTLVLLAALNAACDGLDQLAESVILWGVVVKLPIFESWEVVADGGVGCRQGARASFHPFGG